MTWLARRPGSRIDLHMRCCMCRLDRRVQILLDDARYLKVERAAKRRGVSILIDTTVLSYGYTGRTTSVA